MEGISATNFNSYKEEPDSINTDHRQNYYGEESPTDLAILSKLGKSVRKHSTLPNLSASSFFTGFFLFLAGSSSGYALMLIMLGLYGLYKYG